MRARGGRVVGVGRWPGATGARFSVMPTCARRRRARAAPATAQAVREQQVVRRRAARSASRACPGALVPCGVAEEGDDPRLVEGDPVLDDGRRARSAISAGVLGEALGGVARRPAAGVLQRLRQVPVVERRDRLDAALEQPVDEPAVEVDARAGSARPRPSGCTRGQAIEKR